MPLHVYIPLLLHSKFARFFLHLFYQILRPEVLVIHQLLGHQLLEVLSHRRVQLKPHKEPHNLVETDDKDVQKHHDVIVPVTENKPDTVDTLHVQVLPSVIHDHEDDKRSDACRKNREDQQPSNMTASNQS